MSGEGYLSSCGCRTLRLVGGSCVVTSYGWSYLSPVGGVTSLGASPCCVRKQQLCFQTGIGCC